VRTGGGALVITAFLAAGLLYAASPAADLIERLECARCHDGIAGAAEQPEVKHCVRCHRSIIDRRFDAPPTQLASWEKNLVSMRAAPSLRDIGRVLKREWIEAYLLTPQDLRPRLIATMPRLPLDREAASTIARALAPDDDRDVPPPPSAERISRGATLYEELECASCHAFSGVVRPFPEVPPPNELREMSESMLLAPDLIHTRVRMRWSALLAWLDDPRQVKEDALMPAYALGVEDRISLASFIVGAFATDMPSKRYQRLPILNRRVTYGEVKTRVFQKTCRHCHADPERAFGDGGPGNSGGFGYAGKGLSLASYRSINAGSKDEHGKRRSVFAPLADGTPRLVAHLLARQSEEAAATRPLGSATLPGLVGMPLGLPALTPEELQLVETWIAQGRPEK
jgi:hypothetical protein